MTSITIIDPQPVVRLGLQQILTKAFNGASVTTQDYTALCQAGRASEACDLALLSVQGGCQFGRHVDAVNRLYMPAAILLLTGESDNIDPEQCWNHPLIRGVISKNSTPELLGAAASLVLAGGSCFPHRASKDADGNALVSFYSPEKWPIQPPRAPQRSKVVDEAELLGITPRQYEVLVLLAQGYPLKTVSKQLNISVATAKTHTESLYQRLNVRSRNAAVYAAMKRGATLGCPGVMATPDESGTMVRGADDSKPRNGASL